MTGCKRLNARAFSGGRGLNRENTKTTKDTKTTKGLAAAGGSVERTFGAGFLVVLVSDRPLAAQGASVRCRLTLPF